MSCSSIDLEQFSLLSPNPAVDFVEVTARIRIVEMNLLSSKGLQIYVVPLDDNRLDISRLPSVVYLLNVVMEERGEYHRFVKI